MIPGIMKINVEEDEEEEEEENYVDVQITPF